MNLTTLSSILIVQIVAVIFYLFVLPLVLRYVIRWRGGEINYGTAFLILFLTGIFGAIIQWPLLFFNLGKVRIVIGYMISYFIFSYLFNRFSDLINPLTLGQTLSIYVPYAALSFLLGLYTAPH